MHGHSLAGGGAHLARQLNARHLRRQLLAQLRERPAHRFGVRHPARPAEHRAPRVRDSDGRPLTPTPRTPLLSPAVSRPRRPPWPPFPPMPPASIRPERHAHTHLHGQQPHARVHTPPVPPRRRTCRSAAGPRGSAAPPRATGTAGRLHEQPARPSRFTPLRRGAGPLRRRAPASSRARVTAARVAMSGRPSAAPMPPATRRSRSTLARARGKHTT